VDHVVFSAERLRSLVDWKPQFDLESGLRRTREVMEKQG
jgi:nucleoside-diphosphate-sugar epimerase